MGLFNTKQTYIENGSGTIQNAINSVEGTRLSVEESFRKLLDSFSRASSEWNDRNADATRECLEKGKKIVQKESIRLQELENSLRRLIYIIQEYEN